MTSLCDADGVVLATVTVRWAYPPGGRSGGVQHTVTPEQRAALTRHDDTGGPWSTERAPETLRMVADLLDRSTP